MPISINISGESANEVKDLVSDLASVFHNIPNEKVPAATTVSTLKEPQKQEDKSKKVEASNEAPSQTTSIDEVAIKIEDLRALAKEKSVSDAKRADVKATIAKYGGGGLPNVPKSDYAVLKQELEKL